MTILTQLNAPPIYLICGGIIAFVAAVYGARLKEEPK